MIERDLPLVAAQGIGQYNLGEWPCIGQRADLVAAGVSCRRLQLRLPRQLQGHRDDAGYRCGTDAELLDALVELIAEPFDLLAQISLQPQGSSTGLCLGSLDLSVVHCFTAAQHRLLDLLRQHGAGCPEVVANRVDLPGDAPEEVEVAIERARLCTLEALADEMVDLDNRRRLTMPVDATVALLEPCRRKRDLHVHHAMTLKL